MNRPKRVAYLVNQYPAVSHTFIRREIAAVERDGKVEVVPFSLQRNEHGFVDPADRREAARTRVVPDSATIALVDAILRTALGSPRRFLSGVAITIATGWNSDRGLLRHFAYLAQACVLFRELRDTRAEHVHAHFGTKAAAVALICRALGGPPYSFTIHGPLEFELARLLALSKKIAHAEFVVAISHFCRSQIWRHCKPEHRGKIHIVTCGVDAGFLKEEPAPIPKTPRLVFVGRLSRPKAPELLLEALARLQLEGFEFELTFAGDGELRSQLEGIIEQAHLGARVRIAGFSDEAAVRGFIREARALVLPSFAEGLPVVLMEAFALGRPVVSTYIAGIPELVEPGRSGWLVAASSIEQLIAALREVLQAPTERLEAMGRIGRASVLDRHDAEKSGQALAGLFLGAGSLAAPPRQDVPSRGNV